MATYTKNFNLKKPSEEDFYNIKDFNDNADIIDNKLKELENPFSYGTEDLTPGESPLNTGKLYFVYE